MRQRALLASQSRLLQALVVFSIFGTFVLVSFESAGFYTSQMQGLYLAFSSVFVVELAVKVRQLAQCARINRE